MCVCVVALTAHPGVEKRDESSWHNKVMTASGLSHKVTPLHKQNNMALIVKGFFMVSDRSRLNTLWI